jgi:hypothetical protein
VNLKESELTTAFFPLYCVLDTPERLDLLREGPKGPPVREDRVRAELEEGRVLREDSDSEEGSVVLIRFLGPSPES